MFIYKVLQLGKRQKLFTSIYCFSYSKHSVYELKSKTLPLHGVNLLFATIEFQLYKIAVFSINICIKYNSFG